MVVVVAVEPGIVGMAHAGRRQVEKKAGIVDAAQVVRPEIDKMGKRLCCSFVAVVVGPMVAHRNQGAQRQRKVPCYAPASGYRFPGHSVAEMMAVVALDAADVASVVDAVPTDAGTDDVVAVGYKLPVPDMVRRRCNPRMGMTRTGRSRCHGGVVLDTVRCPTSMMNQRMLVRERAGRRMLVMGDEKNWSDLA